MVRAVLLQAFLSLVTALIALAIGGVDAGWSALLGGAACVGPNALFAWRLSLQARRGSANAVSFLSGEVVKLGLTVIALFVIAKAFHGLNWLAMLAGFVVALKSYLVAFFLDRHLH